MSDNVTLSIDDAVARVMLNRPEKHNALTLDMFEDLTRIGLELRERKDINAIILHGAGDSFCSGLDFQSLTSKPELLQRAFSGSSDSPANFVQRPAFVWRELDAPVIAAIAGNCFGGGLQIALGADIRIASPNAKLSIMEIKWGLVPDMSITRTLPGLVRLDVAKELTFSGRVVHADEALEIGLVTRLADNALSAAEALAADLSGRSPEALRAAKRLFNDAWHAGDSEGLKMEARAQQGLLGRPNQMEAVRANLEKRPPNFSPD